MTKLNMLLEAFQAWIQNRKAALEQHGFSVAAVAVGQDTEKPAVVADLESSAWLARITIWNTGECDMEKLDARSGQSYFENCIISGSNAFDSKLEGFLANLMQSR